MEGDLNIVHFEVSFHDKPNEFQNNGEKFH